MLEVTAINFIRLWKEFHSICEMEELEGQEYSKLFVENNKWTQFILEKPHRLHKDNGTLIRHKIEEYFELVTWAEWRKFDLSGYSSTSFTDMRGYDNEVAPEDYLKGWPRELEILIEHENDPKTCCYEMVKLAYERARLKVLITYPENPGQIEFLQHNFCQIIAQTNSKYSENPATEYLLIVGELEEIKVVWKFFTFDLYGNEIKIDLK